MDKEDIVAVVTVDGKNICNREVPIDTLVIRGPTQMKQEYQYGRRGNGSGGSSCCHGSQTVWRKGNLPGEAGCTDRHPGSKTGGCTGVMVDAVVVLKIPWRSKQTSWYFDLPSGQIHTPLRASSSIRST